MRILHISDLHLSSPKGNRVSDIIERFCKIAEENAKKKSFDYLFVTGDIRNSNGINAAQAFETIKEIAASAGDLPCSRIHIVPGNHDLTRDDDVRAIVIEARKKYDSENGIIDDVQHVLPTLNSRFDDFFWPLSDMLYGGFNPWKNRNTTPHYSVIDQEECSITPEKINTTSHHLCLSSPGKKYQEACIYRLSS